MKLFDQIEPDDEQHSRDCLWGLKSDEEIDMHHLVRLLLAHDAHVHELEARIRVLEELAKKQIG